jgi:hypothetical protein
MDGSFLLLVYRTLHQVIEIGISHLNLVTPKWSPFPMDGMVTWAPCRVKVGFAARLSWSPYGDSLAVLPMATAIVWFAVASG